MMLNRFALAALAVFFPMAAFADLTGTLTLTSGQSVSMDTGATVASGGDFLWSGTTLTPQGKAKAYSNSALNGASTYGLLTSSLISSEAILGSSSPITGLAANSIVVYETNGGNFGKLLVTSLTGTTLTYQYTTYGASSTGSGAGTPTITGVQNNYSYLVAGLPNYGIAQGALFIITGANLASATTVTALQSPATALPTSLNGASISVTVGGVTTTPYIYYAIATQIAAVLPSNTPAGTGTITVTYNGTPSSSAPMTVVTSAFGLDTYYGTGSGLGVATNATTGALYSYTNSIPPGTTVVLWGSGLGSTGDSDSTNTSTPHQVANPPTFYIGGIQVTPLYAGRSVYPGVDQVNITIPSGVATGCGISVVALSGNILSNTMSLPIGSGVCSDPLLGYNGTQLSTLTGQTSAYSQGILEVIQTTSPASTANPSGIQTIAAGIFYKYPASNATSSAGSVASIGSCIVTTSGITTATVTVTTPTGLDAGNITLTGPGGTQSLTEETIPGQSGASGDYLAQLSTAFFGNGGSFTFNGTGGKDVGAFTASISYTNPLVWTNMSSIKTVTRASGQQVTWTGGASGSYTYITGSSSNATASASFVCYAPTNAGQFTVPSYVLLALPTGTNGSLGVANTTTPTTFSASGLTNPGTVIAGVSASITPAYN